jgi:hypothetical protein
MDPIPVRADRASLTARRRAFLLLDGERASLKGRLRSSWHPLGRYEDLCLIAMLTRLERDWLTQPAPRLRDGDRQSKAGDVSAQGAADWAKPWRLAPLAKLDTDARRFELSLRRLGQWLSPLAMVGAERSARERLEKISSQLEGRGPALPGVAAIAAAGRGEKIRMIVRRSRIRMAAAVGVAFAAAATVGLLATSHGGGGSGTSALPPGTVESHVANRPTVLGLGTQMRRATDGGRAGHAAQRSGRQGRRPHGSRHQRAPRQRTAGGTTVVSTPVAPAPQASPTPEPAPVPASAEPAPVSEPSPVSQSRDVSQSSAASKPGSAGGESCPPEFGYEC